MKWGSGGGSHSTSREGEDRDPIEQSPPPKKKEGERIGGMGKGRTYVNVTER